MQYNRLDIKNQAGTILNYPIDAEKIILDPIAFAQDPYVISMKPGIVVTIGAEGHLKPAGTSADEVPLGFLVNDVAGYANQNVNARASSAGAVLVGNGNLIVTDNVKEDNITTGEKLYVDDATGQLTKTKGTLTTPVAVAVSENSATNKALVIQTLI